MVYTEAATDCNFVLYMLWTVQRYYPTPDGQLLAKIRSIYFNHGHLSPKLMVRLLTKFH